MLFNTNKILITFALVLTVLCSFASAERRLMSNLEGNWKLEKVRVLSQESDLADSGYLTISANKEVSYQGLCVSYVGQIVTSQRETKKRSKKRGRAFKFNTAFKLSQIETDGFTCQALDEFEANKDKIFRARFLNRQNGTLKLRIEDTVFTFRKL